jgi:hypothetical protein
MILFLSCPVLSLSLGRNAGWKETQQTARGQDRLDCQLSSDLTFSPPIKVIASPGIVQGFPSSGHQENDNKPARSSLSPKSASFRSWRAVAFKQQPACHFLVTFLNRQV